LFLPFARPAERAYRNMAAYLATAACIPHDLCGRIVGPPQPEISSLEPLDQQVIALLGAYYQQLYKGDGGTV
jgi:hypothetical protein